MNTASREVTLVKFFKPPSEKESTIKGKNLLPMRANSFLLYVDDFMEGHWCIGPQKIGTRKSYLPCKKGGQPY